MSWQAKTVKYLLKRNINKNFDHTKIYKHRKDFERNMRFLFPSYPRGVTIEKRTIAEVPITAFSPLKKSERTIIYIHGGGFVFGSSQGYQQHLMRLAKLCVARVISIDYSLSPENPFPVAFTQVQNVWAALMKDGLDNTKTVIMGDSAGASLALGAVLKFRDRKEKLPACIVLISPPLDATFSGRSYQSNKNNDVLLNAEKIDFFMKAYVQQHRRDDPYISLIFADLTGIPPFLIHVDANEIILSDSEMLIKNAKRDNVAGEIYIAKDMWHGWHLFASYVPEAKAAMQKVVDYIITHTP